MINRVERRQLYRAFWLLLTCLLPLVAPSQTEGRRIMPGDCLQITCLEDPTLCVTRTVEDDGTIALPEFGSVPVATRTPSMVSEHLAALIADDGRFLHPTVIVRTLFERGSPITIAGAVLHGLELKFANGVGLQSLLKLAGTTADAELTLVNVSHADGSTTVIDTTAKDCRLQDGDRVFVPMATGSAVVIVTGGVENPSSVPYRRSMTLADAIEAAGGIAARGNAQRIELIRKGEPLPMSMPGDRDAPINAGETVRVTIREDRRFVAVEGCVAHPGLVEYSPGMTVSQAIGAAGGVVKGRQNDTAWLKTVIGDQKRTVKINLKFLKDKRVLDPMIQPDDLIQVGAVS